MDAKRIAGVAELIGDAARAHMLVALFDVDALPASELAHRARISPQTASAHLGKLCAGGLLTLEKHGRHRYYRLANADVARTVEALMAIAPARAGQADRLPVEADPLHFARSCYDHLAGKVGVAVTEACVAKGWLERAENAYHLTPSGEQGFRDLGLTPEALKAKRRAFAKPCLDWTERRYHLAGALGAALKDTLFERGWFVQPKGSRALHITNRGRLELPKAFGIRL